LLHTSQGSNDSDSYLKNLPTNFQPILKTSTPISTNKHPPTATQLTLFSAQRHEFHVLTDLPYERSKSDFPTNRMNIVRFITIQPEICHDTRQVLFLRKEKEA
jgi:hypothetical protein